VWATRPVVERAVAGEEESDAPPEGNDFGLKSGTVEGEYLGGDDGLGTATNSTDGRGRGTPR